MPAAACSLVADLLCLPARSGGVPRIEQLGPVLCDVELRLQLPL